ncbi:DDE-type integrase/transposase/recombinase [Streptomyces sp. PSKA54]|uniref:DDE-type integrase/transposase/recombinase n=1 Tax=Streptomyces himalayensis subsp. aureolus TaxID=2758039 RepID=A0A7W2HHC4_9ACTN|nr:DDE-type integrase/transposase/recombinase [Streptomyces himalayensis subsp. aureolus]
MSTFLRAVRRDLTAGERAGYRQGPEAARSLDVFAKRPRTWRNHVWEADHVQAPLRVDADGDLIPPYVTWFLDCATKAITGLAVTPGCPTRASVLAALRSAIVRTGPYGPFGGLPEHVRFDRGRDFLSRTVSTALTALDADITVLPPYSPRLKGSIENLNLNVSRMLFAALPGYTPKQSRRPDRRPQTTPPLSFQAFTEELLAWAHWWNTEHRTPPRRAERRHPARGVAGRCDPAQRHPRHGRVVVHVRRRRPNTHHHQPWRALQEPRLHRRLDDRTSRPRHSALHAPSRPRDRSLHTPRPPPGHRVPGRPSHPEQLGALRRTRAQRARRLRAEAKAAEQLRHTRFAPATEASCLRRLDAMTTTEAAHELDQHQHTDLAQLALPDLIPLAHHRPNGQFLMPSRPAPDPPNQPPARTPHDRRPLATRTHRPVRGAA